MIDRIEEFIQQQDMAKEFSPYVELNEQADALTAYFKSDADYSSRLTDHVTLYLSLDNDELIGCRIKGVSGILEDLPNYLSVDHDGVRLSVMFLPYVSAASEEERKMLKKLALASGDMRVPTPA